MLHAELHVANGHRPRVENHFAVADLQILEAAEEAAAASAPEKPKGESNGAPASKPA